MTLRAELQPRILLAGYISGAFPMPDPNDEREIAWFSPDPRGLMPLDERFHVSRRLKATLRQGRFACTLDRDFAGVMRCCGHRAEGTWITRDFRDAYGLLHEMGLAHSAEAWPVGPDGQPAIDRRKGPAGGLYGVALGGAFFAESMFHRPTDAGKVALVYLVEHLRRQGFLLCDVQWLTPNLGRFGAFELPRAAYLEHLTQALARRVKFL